MLTLVVNILKEKLRSKTLYIIGIIGVILLLLITTGDGLSINGEKIITFEQKVPVAMAVNNFLGSIIVIMISLQTIPNEFERKTTHLILSRGIKPWQYMLAMALGNIFTSLVYVFSIYSSLIIFCIILGKGALLLNVLASIFVLSLNTILLSATVSMLSIKVPVFINGALAILLYFIGVFHNIIQASTEMFGGLHGFFTSSLLYIVPNFSSIQLQASNLLLDRPIEPNPLLYHSIYICIVLALTVIQFRQEV